MVQSEPSVLATITDGDDSLRDRIGWRQLNAIVPVLIGMSQIVVAVTTMNPAERSTLFFVVVAGGFLLVGLGVSGFQSKDWFERRPNESKLVAYLGMVLLFTLTGTVVVAAVLFSFGFVWLEPVLLFLSSVVLLEMFSYVVISIWEYFSTGYHR
ncbi:MAG TPA: hypothetical protein VFJ06_10150 [Halococcus sp.]|nr:hypothetical protein [Halococcus sp.]